MSISKVLVSIHIHPVHRSIHASWTKQTKTRSYILIRLIHIEYNIVNFICFCRPEFGTVTVDEDG